MTYAGTLRTNTNMYNRHRSEQYGSGEVYPHHDDRLFRGKVNGVAFVHPYPDCSKIEGKPFGDDRGLPIAVHIEPEYGGWYLYIVCYAGDSHNRPKFIERIEGV